MADGSNINGVPRDWSKGIHSVIIVTKPNFPPYTYYHKIGHQINECPFVEKNVRQRFAEHFQNLYSELARVIMYILNQGIYTMRRLEFQIDLENICGEITE